MRRTGVFLVASLVLVTGGCAPRGDVAAEEAAIRNAGDVELLNAAKTGDVERLVSFQADGASMFPPNAPIATGKEARRGYGLISLQARVLTGRRAAWKCPVQATWLTRGARMSLA